MHDITLDAFLPEHLASIVQWRNDDAVNTFLRPGLRTFTEVQEWYAQYFTRAENNLFAVSCAKTLVGYGTLEHLDVTHRSCEIGIVIGNTLSQCSFRGDFTRYVGNNNGDALAVFIDQVLCKVKQ